MSKRKGRTEKRERERKRERAREGEQWEKGRKKRRRGDKDRELVRAVPARVAINGDGTEEMETGMKVLVIIDWSSPSCYHKMRKREGPWTGGKGKGGNWN